jgi:hypothetical protein
MADGGKVEIQVELEGGGEVQTTLNKIRKQAELLGQRAKEAGDSLSKRFDSMTDSMSDFASSTSTKTLDTLGDSFKKVADNVGTAGGKISQTGQALSSSSNIMTQALGGVISSVGLLTEGLGTLTSASRTAGAGFVSMMGPLLILGTAIFGVVKAVKEYISTSEDLETRLEAMRAAAADYTADLEKLAEEQIALTSAEKTRLREITRQAKAQLEFNQKTREGEGRLGRLIEKRRMEIASIETRIQKIREEASTEEYFLSRTRNLRIKLNLANQFLAETEDKLNGLDEKAIGLLRQKNDLMEVVLHRGKAALAKIREEQQKAAQEIIATNEKMVYFAARLRDEAFAAEERSLSQRIARLRRENAERNRIIREANAADSVAMVEALNAADAAFNAKRRALYKAARAQRETARAREEAARKAAADRAFTDEQNRRRALIMMQTDGFERERQLIDLRFQSAKRAAENEIQLKTAMINKERELLMIQERQAAAEKQAEAERVARIHQSIESMKQEIQIFLARNHALELGVNLTRQQALELIALNYTDMSKITDSLAMYSQGLLYASFAALQSGTSMKAAIGEALKAIALQAGVEAVMQTGRGLAALAEGPLGQVAAYKHFQAAAAFGGVAATAGVVGSRLAPSGGGGGGGGASPTGAAQSFRDRDLDRDEERGGVTINVNMGQAVIYDTKAAAERAFADRVVQAINTPRRGAVRLRGA